MHKPALEVGGRPVLWRVIDAVQGVARCIVVGPGEGVPDGVTVVREDPPGSGPVPALACALPWVTSSWVAVLAGDLPFLRPADIGALLSSAHDGDGAVLVDDRGREQWLVGVWRAAALRHAVRGYGGGSLHGLLRPLLTCRVAWEAPDGTPPPWLDCDTVEDLELARRWTCTS